MDFVVRCARCACDAQSRVSTTFGIKSRRPTGPEEATRGQGQTPHRESFRVAQAYIGAKLQEVKGDISSVRLRCQRDRDD